MTVNELLVLMKAIRERVNGLKSVRSQTATKTSYLYGQDEKRVVEPEYDIKIVDKKIVELETFLFEADSKIKQSNATTKVDIEVDVKVLLKPLE